MHFSIVSTTKDVFFWSNETTLKTHKGWDIDA